MDGSDRNKAIAAAMVAIDRAYNAAMPEASGTGWAGIVIGQLVRAIRGVRHAGGDPTVDDCVAWLRSRYGMRSGLLENPRFSEVFRASCQSILTTLAS